MKYRILTDQTKIVDGQTLYRIQRISDDKRGGWIEKEANLSQEGDCWVYDEACVYGDARVCGAAVVFDDARVFGSARVFEAATISDSAQVYDSAAISGRANVFGQAHAYGASAICDSAEILNSAHVYDSSLIYGSARVAGSSEVYDSAEIFGNAHVYNSAKIFGFAKICGSSQIYGLSQVFGSAQVYGMAHVHKTAKVYDGAKVYGDVNLRFGEFTSDCRTDHEAVIRCSVTPTPFANGKIVLYKRVFKTGDPDIWTSCYDLRFEYHKDRECVVEDADPRWGASCASGLHLSYEDYWHNGDTLIACEVELKDIICVQDGKVRCKRIAKVLGAV